MNQNSFLVPETTAFAKIKAITLINRSNFGNLQFMETMNEF